MTEDPVHQEGELWYFWDETWTERHGPFQDKDEARAAIIKYAKEELGWV